MRRRPWALHAALALMLAALAHGAAVWAVPRLIMWQLARNAPPQMQHGIYFPPPTDHGQRRVVLPSPDLLYATCRFDLARAPLRIRAHPQWPRYWSLALYAANSDNFFVLNDREAGSAPVDLLLAAPGQALPPGSAGAARVVRAPGTRGLLLMRLLLVDPAVEGPAADAARRTLHCEPA